MIAGLYFGMLWAHGLACVIHYAHGMKEKEGARGRCVWRPRAPGLVYACVWLVGGVAGG